MGDGIYSLPQNLDNIVSLDKYEKVCRTLGEKKNANQSFSTDQVFVSNRLTGDGKYQLLFDDKKNDWYCSAEVRWPEHYMNITAGRMSDPKHPWMYQNFRMPDSCSMTQSVAGEDELGGQNCIDGLFDQKLLGADDFASGQKLAKECIASIPITKRYPNKPTTTEFFRQSRILNETDGDGSFSILYQDPERNFFCEGMIDSIQHYMAVRHGGIQDREKTQPEKGIEMNDACSMTRALVGEKDLVGKCEDKTGYERGWEHALNLGFHMVASGLFWYTGGKFALKLYRRGFLGRIPFLGNLGIAVLAATAFDKFTSLFLSEDNPFRKYGTIVAGGTGLVAPSILARTVGTRLTATATLARAGGLMRSLGNRLLAVQALNYGVKWLLVDGDYDASLNKRATDIVYKEDDVYELRWYDVFILPAAVKLVRGGCRWIAPDAMEWGVTLTGHGEDVKDQLEKQDRDASVELTQFINEVLPPLMHYDKEIGVDPNTTIEMLKDPIDLSIPEIWQEVTLEHDGAEALMKEENMTAQEVEAFARKVTLKKVQDAAKFLVYVDQDLNQWSHAIFNANGTLKENVVGGTYEEQPYAKLLHHLPAYTPPQTDPWE